MSDNEYLSRNSELAIIVGEGRARYSRAPYTVLFVSENGTSEKTFKTKKNARAILEHSGFVHCTGIILEEKKSILTGDDIVVIATFNSSNIKTANMIQIWIMVRKVSPVIAHSTGCDIAVCGNCPHRENGTCYVALFQGPRAVWQAYADGKYARFNGNFSVFSGRKVRFGAYGDPSLISPDIVFGIMESCAGWTGYTHQWSQGFASVFSKVFMASTDNPVQVKIANEQGWSTFMALPQSTTKKDMPFSCSICPAALSEKVHCLGCGKCNGSQSRLRNVVIPVHGKGEKAYSFA